MPSDSGVFIDGCYYKIGRLNLAYIWVNEQWRTTTRPKREILNAIEREEESRYAAEQQRAKDEKEQIERAKKPRKRTKKRRVQEECV